MGLIKCTECGHEISSKAEKCPNCGCPVSKMANLPVMKNGELLRCPKCKSDNIKIVNTKHYHEEQKVKTSYSANLNPLKPFTFANKKEKIVKPSRDFDKNYYECKSCGYRFDDNDVSYGLGYILIGAFLLVIILGIIF